MSSKVMEINPLKFAFHSRWIPSSMNLLYYWGEHKKQKVRSTWISFIFNANNIHSIYNKCEFTLYNVHHSLLYEHSSLFLFPLVTVITRGSSQQPWITSNSKRYSPFIAIPSVLAHFKRLNVESPPIPLFWFQCSYPPHNELTW